jgi:hypothetical protein
MFPEGDFCASCGEKRPFAAQAVPHPAGDRALEIRRIGVWSLVKFSFMMYALFGIVIGIFIVGVGLSGVAAQHLGEGVLHGMPWAAILFVSFLIHGIVGAIVGLLVGSLYNLLAWGVGGVRITLKGSVIETK